MAGSANGPSASPAQHNTALLYPPRPCLPLRQASPLTSESFSLDPLFAGVGPHQGAHPPRAPLVWPLGCTCWWCAVQQQPRPHGWPCKASDEWRASPIPRMEQHEAVHRSRPFLCSDLQTGEGAAGARPQEVQIHALPPESPRGGPGHIPVVCNAGSPKDCRRAQVLSLFSKAGEACSGVGVSTARQDHEGGRPDDGSCRGPGVQMPEIADDQHRPRCRNLFQVGAQTNVSR